MKKLSFIFLTTVCVMFLVACGSDTADCSMVGEWKVKSVDYKSETIDKGILEMAKGMTLAMTYNFTADSVTVVSNGVATHTGPYQVEPGKEERLTWNTMGKEGIPYIEDMKIMSCSGNEISLLQRSPVDTSKQEVMSATLVLEKVKK